MTEIKEPKQITVERTYIVCDGCQKKVESSEIGYNGTTWKNLRVDFFATNSEGYKENFTNSLHGCSDACLAKVLTDLAAKIKAHVIGTEYPGRRIA